MNAPARINPYLSGNFAPVRSEDDFADLPVKGEIPKDLAGRLYRTGPNPQFDPRDPHYHWFCGRRHAARLPSRKRQGELSQPLRPHAEMGVGARGRQIAVRHVWQSDDDRSRRRSARIAASPTPISCCMPASCLRWKKATSLSKSIQDARPERLSSLCRRRAAASPPIPRSIPKPARCCSSAIWRATIPLDQSHGLRRRGQGGQGDAARSVSMRRSPAWSTISW